MAKVVLAYVPVLHRGYSEFFLAHRNVETCYVVGDALIGEFDHLRKDCRALEPRFAARAIRSLNIFSDIQIALPETLHALAAVGATVIMPDEEECRLIAANYLARCQLEFDRRVFLRWDKTNALAENGVKADRTVSLDGFTAEIMRCAFTEAEQATNLWRRVGAVAARDGEILLAAHNTQVPSLRTPYYEGDPRGLFKRGLHLELTTDDHAERRIIAEAARKGVALEGSDLFVTTFPCPPCGKQISFTGIRRLYFAEGYAVLDSERILRDSGLEIVRVEMKTPGS